MNNVAKTAIGIGAGVVAYGALKSLYYNSLKKKARANAEKMDIYYWDIGTGTYHSFAVKDKITDLVQSMKKAGNITFMRPSYHFVKGKQRLIPCILVKDNFTELGISKFYVSLASIGVINKKELYHQLLGENSSTDYLRNAGGAFSTIVKIAPGYGIFDESIVKPEDYDSDGFTDVAVIVVDDDLKICGITDSTISAVIHHEFWHTYKSNGYIENILNCDTNHLNVSSKGIIACPKEEIECDAFAWKNVGVDLNVSTLIDKYAKCGKIIGTIAKLKLMTEGRM